MKQFAGFPLKTEYAPVPAAFFSALLPAISDVNELKVSLHLFRVLIPKRLNPRYVTFTELASDTALIATLASNSTPLTALRTALAAAVKRGTFLHIGFKGAHGREDVYMLNTERDRKIRERIINREFRLPLLEPRQPATDTVTPSPPNIFALYEENIGLLTPLIAEELKEAEKLYPAEWIRDAFKEAVKANRRRWRFVAFLLEQWATEGRKDGAYQRDLKATDPDKYFKDRYGRFFQR
jgi:DnaD/phage-associated family protein